MNIVILGSTSASAKVIEQIRLNDQNSELTLFSFDGHYPYSRHQFPAFISKSIAPEQVFSQAKDFYECNKVKMIFDFKITRINVKRKKIFTEDKQQIDYDVLIIADTPENRHVDIKGTNKSNVFGYKKLKDIDQLSNDLPIIETVAIQSDSFSGLQAAAAISKREKEVIFVSSQNDFLGKHFDEHTLLWVKTQFEESGIRLMRNNAITEILGEKEAKAIRLKEGKVYSSEIILFGEMNEDLRLFADSGLQMDNKINVNEHFQAGMDSIYAVDQVCAQEAQTHWYDSEPVTPNSVIEMQAKTVAAALSGQASQASLPVMTWELEVKGLSISVIGDITLDDSRSIRRTFDRESGTYKGVYVKDNYAVGALLINTQNEKDQIINLINTKVQLEPEAAGLAAESSTEGISTELIDN